MRRLLLFLSPAFEAPASPRGRNMMSRIKAYKLDGTRVCLPGFEGDKWGTLPHAWEVSDLYKTPGWIEVLAQPAEGERAQRNIHWKPVEPVLWTPKTVIFCRADGSSVIGVAGDRLGDFDATHLQLLSTESQIQVRDTQPMGEEALFNVPTPPTPDPFQMDYWVSD